MVRNLTCFKCHNDTAILTYEEKRMYKVSCPCGCEYSFEHSSMVCAEEYHWREVQLHGEIEKNKELQRLLLKNQNELNQELSKQLYEMKKELNATIDFYKNKEFNAINCLKNIERDLISGKILLGVYESSE